jgi:hypothetical protein
VESRGRNKTLVPRWVRWVGGEWRRHKQLKSANVHVDSCNQSISESVNLPTGSCLNFNAAVTRWWRHSRQVKTTAAHTDALSVHPLLVIDRSSFPKSQRAHISQQCIYSFLEWPGGIQDGNPLLPHLFSRKKCGNAPDFYTFIARNWSLGDLNWIHICPCAWLRTTTGPVDVAVALKTFVREELGSGLGQDTSCLGLWSLWFSWAPLEKYRDCASSRPRHFFSNRFQLISRPLPLYGHDNDSIFE